MACCVIAMGIILCAVLGGRWLAGAVLIFGGVLGLIASLFIAKSSEEDEPRGKEDPADRLREVTRLLDSGVISQDEYSRIKDKILKEKW